MGANDQNSDACSSTAPPHDPDLQADATNAISTGRATRGRLALLTGRPLAALLARAEQTLANDPAETRRCIVDARALLASTPLIVFETIDGSTQTGLMPTWRLERVEQYVEANLSQTLCLRDLAARAGLSMSQFSTAFRRSTGQTPHAYVVHKRIARAMVAMMHTSRSLSQIALDCGLADQAHLTRWFRRIVGVSPAAWRRSSADAARASHITAPSVRDRGQSGRFTT